MKLSNELLINAPADQAWALLTDLGRIAPIMPGASLENVDGGEFSGTMSVKVGPIAVKYRGTTYIQEADAAGRRAVISARGADASGQGQVQALITAQLMPEGTQTRVLVDTDINISGRLAQFGRGALADISARLMNEFVRNLDAVLTQAPAQPGAPESGAPASGGIDPGAAAPGPPESGVAAPGPTGPAAAGPPSSGSINLVSVVGPVLARRAAPVLAGAVAGGVAGALVMRWLMRRSR